MYADGHWGINLILFSPVAFVLSIYKIYTLLIFTAACVLFIARRPDDDMKLQTWTSRLRDLPLLNYIVPQITHRGITHTVWYAILWGLLVGMVTVVYTATIDPLQLFSSETMHLIVFGTYGFILGFFGIIGHMIGDVITPSGIKPLYPLKTNRYTLDLVYAKNRIANSLFFFFGFILWILAIGVGTFYF